MNPSNKLFVHINDIVGNFSIRSWLENELRADNSVRVTYTHHYQQEKKKFQAVDVKFSEVAGKGTVKRWVHHADPGKRYGFICPSTGGDDLLVRGTNIRGENNCLAEGKPVSYTRRYDPDEKKFVAVDVKGDACYEYFDEREWRRKPIKGTKIIVLAEALYGLSLFSKPTSPITHLFYLCNMFYRLQSWRHSICSRNHGR